MAFMFINTELNTEKETINELNKIPEVQKIYPIYGVYDMVVRIETDTMQELKDLIVEIRRPKKIKSTLTMIVVSETPY